MPSKYSPNKLLQGDSVCLTHAKNVDLRKIWQLRDIFDLNLLDLATYDFNVSIENDEFSLKTTWMIKDLENSGRQFELNVSEKLLFEQKILCLLERPLELQTDCTIK